MDVGCDAQAGLRELGAEAVWSLSSAKPGNGVEQLRDDSLSTYWQSDGAGPHLINIQFLRKTSISAINIYLNYALDESYTPKRVSVRAGTTVHDMVDITTVDLQEPSGWVSVPLSSQDIGSPGPLRTHILQVRVLSMHQNGRDTHLRQVKVFGPRSSPSVMGSMKMDNFKTIDMLQYSLIR